MAIAMKNMRLEGYLGVEAVHAIDAHEPITCVAFQSSFVLFLDGSGCFFASESKTTCLRVHFWRHSDWLCFGCRS